MVSDEWQLPISFSLSKRVDPKCVPYFPLVFTVLTRYPVINCCFLIHTIHVAINDGSWIRSADWSHKALLGYELE